MTFHNDIPIFYCMDNKFDEICKHLDLKDNFAPNSSVIRYSDLKIFPEIDNTTVDIYTASLNLIYSNALTYHIFIKKIDIKKSELFFPLINFNRLKHSNYELGWKHLVSNLDTENITITNTPLNECLEMINYNISTITKLIKIANSKEIEDLNIKYIEISKKLENNKSITTGVINKMLTISEIT